MGAAVPQVVTESSASGAQVIDGSLKFDSGLSNYLNRTPSSSGNRKTWTWSGWVKRNKLGATQFVFEAGSADTATDRFLVRFQSDDTLLVTVAQANNRLTSQVFRDVSSWGHLVIAVDTTQSTANDRSKIYWNGSQITDFSTITNPNQDAITAVNSAAAHSIGKTHIDNSNYLDGYQSNIYLIDGQALGPENFGFTDPLTNTWRPKKYTGDFNISSSGYAGIFAPYSTTARWNSFKTYTTVNENSTGHTLPMSNPSHYGGKALDLASGGFEIQTNNSAAGDFFMAIWVNLDSYETNKQFGVDMAGNYVFFETLSNGAIKVRHTGSGGQSSNSGYANDTNQWQHWALSRSGGSLRGFVDGEQIVTDTGGISGDNTVLANSKFNFFGADNNTTSYNINGQVIDAVIYIGQGVSGNFTPPTAPLIDSSGNINHYSGFSDSQLYFASPLVDVSGSTPNTIANYIQTGVNSFYLPMDGNSPIGEDKSPKGNNWTPVNFGGSVALDNPIVSGARPILNTGTGGTVARPGVFGSEVGAYYAVTVASVGGGNRYHFDGVDRPNPTLTRGATYTFDQSNNSNSTHPLRFATAADAAGSSQYTDGVVTSGTPGSAGAYTKITVPHNAPDTLHYYCTNHGGMGSSTSQITDETKADPYAWKNVLALPLVGSANDVSNSVNSGSTTKAVTNNNVTFNSISHFYGGSALFNSSSDYLRLASAPFDYGSGDFTIEFWCYLNGNFNTARHIISAWEDGGNQTFYLGTGGSNGYWGSFGVKIGGTQYEVNGDANKGRISQNGWHHIAGVRDGTNIKLFVDGNLIGTTACGSGSMISLPTYVYIGKHYSASGYEWEGLLSDVRIYKGVAKYTSNFIPASTSPDILPDTPSGVSGSSKLAKITDGAVSFDGSGDYLTGNTEVLCWLHL